MNKLILTIVAYVTIILMFANCKRIDRHYDHEETFIAYLQEELYNKTESQLKENVEDRFDIWSMPRMLWQTLITNNEKRRIYAEEELTEGINRQELQDWINEEIDTFNKYNIDNAHIEPVVLTSMHRCIVTDELWNEIDSREWMEWTDLIGGSVFWVILTIIIGYIIGYALGAMLGDVSGCAGIGCLGQIIDLLVLFAWGYFMSDIFIEKDAIINNLVMENYHMWLNNQVSISNLIMQ